MTQHVGRSPQKYLLVLSVGSRSGSTRAEAAQFWPASNSPSSSVPSSERDYRGSRAAGFSHEDGGEQVNQTFQLQIGCDYAALQRRMVSCTAPANY